MPVSHFTESIAYQPGTSARTGAPCSRGSGSPFIVVASSVSGAVAFATGIDRGERVRAGQFAERPRVGTVEHDLDRVVAQAGRDRARDASATPPHCAWLSAPRLHCTPEIGGENSVRR